jgi:hypothetical protein
VWITEEVARLIRLNHHNQPYIRNEKFLVPIAARFSAAFVHEVLGL